MSSRTRRPVDFLLLTHTAVVWLFVNGVEQKQGYGDQSPPGDPDEVSFLFDWQEQYSLKLNSKS